MPITDKQLNFIIYLLERSFDARLTRLWGRIPAHTAVYSDKRADYRRLIFRDALAGKMGRREAGELIGAIKSPSDKNIIKVESILKLYKIIE